MSTFQEPHPPVLHPPVKEPAASDGSTLTVVRDTQGEIREASGTGHDGVVRRLSITRKHATNPAGFHFMSIQLDFFEQGKEYLRLGSVLSPDAGKASVQAYSGTSQFGLAVGVARNGSRASVITTTGSRATVDLSRVSPLDTLSQKPLPPAKAAAVHGTLAPPAPGIQEALKRAEYFQPLLEQEYTRFVALLATSLQAVHLSATMHADALVSGPSDHPSAGGSVGADRKKENEQKVLEIGKNAALGAAVALAIANTFFGVTISFSGGLLIVGIVGLVTIVVIELISPADEPLVPVGTNDTPPADVVPEPLDAGSAPEETQPPPVVLPPPIPDPTDGGVPPDVVLEPPDPGSPPEETQPPPVTLPAPLPDSTDGGVTPDASAPLPDVNAWKSLPDGGWGSTLGEQPTGEVASGGPSGESGGSEGGRAGGGDAGVVGSGGPSGSSSGEGSSGPSGEGGPGSSSGGGSSGGSGGSGEGGSNGSEGGGSSGGDSGSSGSDGNDSGSSGGESGGGEGGGGGESIGTGEVTKRTGAGGDPSDTTIPRSPSSPRRPPEPPPA